MIILGIETSCDETAAAIIQTNTKDDRSIIISSKLATSMATHAATGGIIPETAAREQIKYIIPVIRETLEKAGISVQNARKHIDAIAVTYGPGLIGSLLVGVETAKTLALVWDKPLIPVNHLFGHIYANWLNLSPNEPNDPPLFPAIALIVSGGHTDLVLMKNHQQIVWLGGTRDDAAGEALDKTGRLLHLPYPGGIAIEQKAKHGNPKAYHLPRPIMYDKGYDFSFSGLKTAVLREVQMQKELSEQFVADISLAMQTAIFDVLVYKTINAAKEYQAASIILGGGVSANQTLRQRFISAIEKKVKFFAPVPHLSTDNAAMIAAAGFYHHQTLDYQEVTANPQLYFD